MKSYDVIVIGGGVLGCFALREMTKYNVSAALFERREDLCTGISRANTAIVYSGCDTKPGTIKTDMCVRSAQNFDKLCEELGVRYRRCGSLMVSFGPSGEKSLRKKYENSIKNGVRDVRLLSGSEVLTIEPGLSPDVTLGLFVPDTGTVNPWELCLAAAQNAIDNGAQLFFNTEVTGISPAHRGYIIQTVGGEFFTRGVINCAGLGSDKVHEMVNMPQVRIVPTTGDYLVLDTKAAGAVRHVVFHEPEERRKGLTLVPTIDGNILIGPTENNFAGGKPYNSSLEGIKLLHELAAKVAPKLPMEHVIRSFGAMRPNPFRVAEQGGGQYAITKESVSDFCILTPGENFGFVSLVGIKTPGLTCAHELGLHVSGIMANTLGLSENKTFNPRRGIPVRLSDLPFDARAALVQRDPAYGKIICRCREISEGEIIEAIRQNPGAVTVDGVKRRVGATSGRCQGSFCTQRIIEIMATETGRKPEAIEKDEPGSYIIGGGAYDV